MLYQPSSVYPVSDPSLFLLTIIRRPAQRPRDIRYIFRESQIRHFDMTIRTEKDVFWFEISIDDVEGMEVIDCESDFGCVEFGDGVWESLW